MILLKMKDFIQLQELFTSIYSWISDIKMDNIYEMRSINILVEDLFMLLLILKIFMLIIIT